MTGSASATEYEPTLEDDILTVRNILNVFGIGRQMYTGTGANSQTIGLNSLADAIVQVRVWDDANKVWIQLKLVAALAAETMGYTFTLSNLITFGNATNGYKPANGAILQVIYIEKKSGKFSAPLATYTTNIAAGASGSTSYVDVSAYRFLLIGCNMDKIGQIDIYQSYDGITDDVHSIPITFPPSNKDGFVENRVCPYAKITITNNDTAITTSVKAVLCGGN